MDFYTAPVATAPSYFPTTPLASSSIHFHSLDAQHFQMQTRSQKRRRSPSGSEQSNKQPPSKKRLTSEQALTLAIPDSLNSLPGSIIPQWPLAASSFTPRRTGSPLESTLSGTPSPAPSAWGGADADYGWNVLREGPAATIHADFLQATRGMRIDDSAGDGDADMDTYQEELLTASMISDKDFIIPALHLQPPTPLLLQSPEQPIVPTSPTPTLQPVAHTTSPSRPSAASLQRKRFVMGPREGCEKCRLKVPGHYGHID